MSCYAIRPRSTSGLHQETQVSFSALSTPLLPPNTFFVYVYLLPFCQLLLSTFVARLYTLEPCAFPCLLTYDPPARCQFTLYATDLQPDHPCVNPHCRTRPFRQPQQTRATLCDLYHPSRGLAALYSSLPCPSLSAFQCACSPPHQVYTREHTVPFSCWRGSTLQKWSTVQRASRLCGDDGCESSSGLQSLDEPIVLSIFALYRPSRLTSTTGCGKFGATYV